MRALIVIALLTGLMLAGCIGGEEDVDSDGNGGSDGGSGATTGSIAGRVVDGGFDPVTAADILLMDQGGAKNIKNATTDPDGNFRIGNVEAGEYRLAVETVCCEAKQISVTVVAGEETNADVQIERLPDTGDVIRVDTEGEWSGYISCSISFYSSQTPAPCTTNNMDPNRDDIREWKADPGLMTIVVGMVWDKVPTNTEDGLRHWLFRFDEEAGDEGQWQSMSRHHTPSPMNYRWEYDEATQGERDFQFRIYAGCCTYVGGNTGLVVQQAFTVYWHLFYGERAPDGHSALPDA